MSLGTRRIDFQTFHVHSHLGVLFDATLSAAAAWTHPAAKPATCPTEVAYDASAKTPSSRRHSLDRAVPIVSYRACVGCPTRRRTSESSFLRISSGRRLQSAPCASTTASPLVTEQSHTVCLFLVGKAQNAARSGDNVATWTPRVAVDDSATLKAPHFHSRFAIRDKPGGDFDGVRPFSSGS